MRSFFENLAWKRKTQHGLRIKENLASDPETVGKTRQGELTKLKQRLENERMIDPKNSEKLAKILIKMRRGLKLEPEETSYLLRIGLTPRYPIKKLSEVQKIPKDVYDLGSHKVNTEKLELADLDLDDVELGFRGFEPAKVDLQSRAYIYERNLNIFINRRGHNIDTCPSCEGYFHNVFGLGYPYNKRGYGVVLRLGGKVVGIVKMDGVKSFLASRTVKDKYGKNILIKGMIYGLTKDDLDVVKSNRINYGNLWPKVDIENLARNNTFRLRQQRFIYDKDVFDYLDEFTDKMDS